MWLKGDASKNICNDELQLFFEMNEEYKVSCIKILLEGRYLFEILHTSPTVKSRRNVVKLDVCKNLLDGERIFFSQIKEGYKV